MDNVEVLIAKLHRCYGSFQVHMEGLRQPGLSQERWKYHAEYLEIFYTAWTETLKELSAMIDEQEIKSIVAKIKAEQ